VIEGDRGGMLLSGSVGLLSLELAPVVVRTDFFLAVWQ